MKVYWIESDGADPLRIGSGLQTQIASMCPEFEWVAPPRNVGTERFLGMFCARTDVRARRVGLLVSILGDADVAVWPVEGGELHYELAVAQT